MDKKAERLLLKDVTAVLEKHPGLMVTFNKDVPVKLYGTYQLRDEVHGLQGEWEIAIPIPLRYPHAFPFLFETSGLIPPTPDRHMNAYRIACTELDIRAEARARKGITLSQFLTEYVARYFSWQLLYEAGHKHELNSWGHGSDGPREYFYEALSTKSHDLIYKALTLLHQRDSPRRNDPCFCQSGKKYKACHEPGMNEILCRVGISGVKQKRDDLFFSYSII
jgi:hypothetical protein